MEVRILVASICLMHAVLCIKVDPGSNSNLIPGFFLPADNVSNVQKKAETDEQNDPLRNRYPPQAQTNLPLNNLQTNQPQSNLLTQPLTQGNQGMNQGVNQRMNTGMNQGLNPGFNQGVNQGMNPGMNQGVYQGMNQGMNQGINPVMTQGINPGFNQGINPGMGLGNQGMNQGVNQGPPMNQMNPYQNTYPYQQGVNQPYPNQPMNQQPMMVQPLPNQQVYLNQIPQNQGYLVQQPQNQQPILLNTQPIMFPNRQGYITNQNMLPNGMVQAGGQMLAPAQNQGLYAMVPVNNQQNMNNGQYFVPLQQPTGNVLLNSG